MMLQTDEFHICTHTWGETSLPPLLMLHGFLGTGEDWRAIAERLATNFYVIAPDIPGHGSTQATNTNADNTNADLLALPLSMERVAHAMLGTLDALGIERSYLCGYSMGGRLALYLALRFPERFRAALILSATAGLQTEEERRIRQDSDEKLAQRLETEPFEQFLTFWYNQPLFASLREHFSLEELVQKRQISNSQGAALSLRGMGTGAQPPLWNELSHNRIPVTFASGALDKKFTALAEELHARTPSSALEIIPNAGHALHLESAEAVVRLCNRFLSPYQSTTDGNTHNH
jgi:2-succinyl-6-hydroxy-2,4-cyclohexadiene-1-carboxylate synthase